MRNPGEAPTSEEPMQAVGSAQQHPLKDLHLL